MNAESPRDYQSDLRKRTKAFALRIIKLSGALPAGRVGEVIGRQILKSGTSIGANWREATRASSKRHFISTTEICIREADETLYWLELLAESEAVRPSRLAAISDECNQLVAILTATAKRTKQGLRVQESKSRPIQNS
jgi:four helix bundle protein